MVYEIYAYKQIYKFWCLNCVLQLWRQSSTTCINSQSSVSCLLMNIDQKSKLYLFSNLKQNLSVESYLSISNFEYRKLITKLRISEHNLLIEKGGHLNIP